MPLVPLVTDIQNNRDIQEICVKGKEYRMSVYADDLLIYVTNPIMTLPNIKQEFKRFGKVSIFKNNYDNSVMLNVSFSNKVQELLKKNFPFKWLKVAIKYPRIYIPRDMAKLQEFYYSPIVCKVIKLLQRYDNIVYSWMGRINVVKTEILRKLL